MKRLVQSVVLVTLLIAMAGRTQAAGAPSVPSPAPARTMTDPHADAKATCTIVALAAFLLCANVAVFAGAIAANFRRSLAYDAADEWENPLYRKTLPNVLALLRIKGFASAWPAKCNPWSMHRFERKLLHTVRPLLKVRSKTFVERHLSVWIWVESHRDECAAFVRIRQIDRALEALATARTSSSRADILAFLDASPQDPHPFDDATTGKLRELQQLQTIMREHGFSVRGAFEESDRLALAAGDELADLFTCRHQTH